jgi:hypothetical protein
MSETLIDYTKARLNSKSYRGRRIERCPRCGKKGEHSTYQRGGEMYVHTLVEGMWAATTGEHCIIGIIR